MGLIGVIGLLSIVIVVLLAIIAILTLSIGYDRSYYGNSRDINSYSVRDYTTGNYSAGYGNIYTGGHASNQFVAGMGH